MMSTPLESTCLLSLWRTNDKGYACRSVRTGDKVRKVYAHRQAYEEARGPIPAGKHIHHLCGVKTCINPDHLRLSTPEENASLGRPCPDPTCTCVCHEV